MGGIEVTLPVPETEVGMWVGWRSGGLELSGGSCG